MKYVGTIGDVRHFKIKGQEGFFAGMVGGPTAEQVNNAPEFERTRENMNEFGGCAKVGKSLRTALSALMGKFTDPQVTGRLTSIMKKINLEDETKPEVTERWKFPHRKIICLGSSSTKIFLSPGSSMLRMTLSRTPEELLQISSWRRLILLI